MARFGSLCLPLALCRSFSDLRSCTIDENWAEMHSRRCQGCKCLVKLTETSCTACSLVERSDPFSTDRLRMSWSLATKQWQGLVSMQPAILGMLATCRLCVDSPAQHWLPLIGNFSKTFIRANMGGNSNSSFHLFILFLLIIATVLLH